MNNVVFRPQSWTRSGDAFLQEGSDIARKVEATLGRMSVDALGCTKGGHAADIALSLVVPPLLDVFTEAINGMAEGFSVTGDVLSATGVAYANTEEANTAAGNDAATA